MSTLGIKQVIVARRDLDMPPGKLAAQVAHGSISFITRTAFKSSDKYFFREYRNQAEREWLVGDSGFTKVVLGCDDEVELFALFTTANDLRLEAHLIKDSAFTVFAEPTYTVLAIGPDTDENIDKVTGHLTLY